MAETRRIKVEALARVEGEGSLRVTVRDGRIKDLHFGIFEPPRFFEAFLRGRDYREVPDITARICGICPVAYLLGASLAMEDALGIEVAGPLADLRRLAYCGEWIESHALHVYMLHAPDFLGLADALELAAHDRALVERALRLKQIGNRILEAVGGRAVHPVNFRVGGFYRTPRKDEIRALIPDLEWGLDAAVETVRLVAGFDFPHLEQDYTFMALSHGDEYAIHRGELARSNGMRGPVPAFLEQIDEEHVPWSNALSGKALDGSHHFVGPLARYALNYDRLSARARAAAEQAGLGRVVRNPFKSIVVRAVELVQAYGDALELAQNYSEPDRPFIEAKVRAGEGHGATEAPRGLCYHRYRIDGDGTVLDARIVPPTAQNQRAIELDLWSVVGANLDQPDETVKWRAEQAIRNYDPCISCATHFLKLEMDRQS